MENARRYAQMAALPPERADEFFNDWRNVSCYTDKELFAYLEYVMYDKFVYVIALGCNSFVHLAAGILGNIGAILSILVLFRNKEFSGSSWIYHKCVVMFEVLGMSTSIYLGIGLAFPVAKRTVPLMWTFYTPILTFKDTSTQGSDAVTFFMSLERTVALWLPRMFHTINQKRVVVSICALCLLDAFTKWYGWWSFDLNVDRDGVTVKGSEAATTPAYGIAKAVSSALMNFAAFGTVITTVFVITGMIRRAKARARSVIDDERTSLKQTLQLSLLCLTCSIPMAISILLWTVDNQYLKVYGNNLSRPTGMTAVQSIQFADAMFHQSMLVISKVAGVIYTLLGAIEHGGHFYFYYLFNTMFREKAKELLAPLAAKLKWRGHRVGNTAGSSIEESALHSAAATV